MTRYLIDPFLRSALNRGRNVAQFLGGFDADGEPAIRWLTLRADGGTFVLSLWEAVEPKEVFYDVWEFKGLGDEPYEPTAEHRCKTIDDALALAGTAYGANRDRWVNESMVGDEYHDFREGRWPPE